jgi:uroporphyrinogen-III synthase
MSTGVRPVLLAVRPPDRMDDLAEHLDQASYRIICAPSLTYASRPDLPLVDLSPIQALVATSGRALDGLRDKLDGLRTLPLYVVGAASARRAQSLGFDRIAGVVPDVAALGQLLNTHISGHHILYVRGDQIAQPLGLVPDIRVTEMVTYYTQPLEELADDAMAALTGGHVRAVLFFSSLSAGHFCKLVDKAGLVPHTRTLSALCLSSAVLGSLLSNQWADIRSAITPDMPGMIRLVRTLP